jgi:hypothetical protein
VKDSLVPGTAEERAFVGRECQDADGSFVVPEHMMALLKMVRMFKGF